MPNREEWENMTDKEKLATLEELKPTTDSAKIINNKKEE
jgi:predicted Fe-S protein YdhL (DUF1289 family)